MTDVRFLSREEVTQNLQVERRTLRLVNGWHTTDACFPCDAEASSRTRKC